jgi:hypothetical protein
VLAPHFIQQVAEAFFANLDSFLGNKRPWWFVLQFASSFLACGTRTKNVSDLSFQ